MDEPGQSANQFSYTADPDKASRMMNRPTSMLGNQVATRTSQEKLVQHQPSYQQQQQQSFSANQRQVIRGATDIKNHCLPLARIKKIMKADRDVKMIAAEAPVLFARACEMFIMELTHLSWAHAEENKRRTLLKDDIAGAIARSDILDFLEDVMPRDKLKDEDGPLAYHYAPPQGSFMGMIMGNSEVDPEFLCPQQPQPYVPEQQVWEQQQTVQQVQWQPEDEYAQQQLWEQQPTNQQQKKPEDYS